MRTRQNILERRPLSPHLEIYKPQISSSLSILHRLTGIIMFFGLILLSWLIIILQFNDFPDSLLIEYRFIVQLVLYPLSYACIYHFLNGIRHLFWDIGLGFSIKIMNISGWAVIACSIGLTFCLWSS